MNSFTAFFPKSLRLTRVSSQNFSKALLSAWKEACASTTPAKVLIPGGTFALTEVALDGPCKAPVEFELQGTLKAPADPSLFKTDGWVVFQHIDGLTMSGGGTFDGQGKTAWGQNDCDKNTDCRTLPTVSTRRYYSFLCRFRTARSVE